MSRLGGVRRLALVLGAGAAAAAAARGRRLPLRASRLAALRPRFSSAAYPTAAARSRFATGLGSFPIDKCGGIVDEPGRETHPDDIELARFAVAEHNSKTGAALEFVRLVKVRTQLVAGTMYYLTVEAREVDGGGAIKLYEAKVWLRPWEKFKGLNAFEPVANADEGEEDVVTPFSC